MSALNEGLKTIAIYMDYVECANQDEWIEAVVNQQKKAFINVSKLRYHTDYNLLMPVAKKVKEELSVIYDSCRDFFLRKKIDHIYEEINRQVWGITGLLSATISGIELINQYKTEPK